ncbi:epididymal protein 13 [Camelus bactrianus]|uniref:Epididymal protein 13 n=1 Tax=Camelus bactrianus TaxID=9837 RepID=A0AC58QXE6_CAMBA
MHKPGPPLKMFLLILCFLGLAEACIPREVATEEKISFSLLWSRLSWPLGPNTLDVVCTPEPGLASRTALPFGWMTPEILGLLSLQVLNEETNGCKEEVKLFPATTTPKKPPKKKTRWNGLRCAYMMITFLFVSYNKGDWCYCHYCNPELDNRNDPCCAF